MRFKFSGRAELGKAGDFEIFAWVGDMQVRCVIKREAVTAGLAEAYISDAQMLQLFASRSCELESIASQRFFNGESSPVIKRHHMFH